MKRSTSNLQTVLLASVLSAALVFSIVVFSFNGYYTQIAHAEQNTQVGEMTKGGVADDLISPITERVGMAAIGMTAGLSISVGIIHLLLVKEHMRESYIWGIGFLSMGIPQILYGMIIMMFAKNFLSSAKTYCITLESLEMSYS